jgi:hypothetical protein
VRDIETIDAELRLLSRAWQVARVLSEQMPSTELIDRLLDERSKCSHDRRLLEPPPSAFRAAAKPRPQLDSLTIRF